MRIVDAKAIDGKFPEITETIDTLVIGAGRAGRYAAREAAAAGAEVMLADENPLDPALMGTDIPLAFGGRMDGAVQNRARMTERLVSAHPDLAEAFDAGIDVRLGTTVWGLYPESEESRALCGLVVGLEDGERCWLARARRVVVATGARDLMLGFAGCDQPGVIGARALDSLLHRYQAFAGRRILVLGAGAEGLAAALAAARAGITVAAVVEPGPAPCGPASLAAEVEAAGIPILTRHAILAADGNAEGVTTARLVGLDGGLQPLPGSEREIACDTICLAIAFVPVIELLAAAGCAVTFDGRRGGFIPVLDTTGRTSIPAIAVAGSAAGLAAAPHGAPAALPDEDLPREDLSREDWPYPELWLSALIATGGLEVPCCRCESVTRGDVLGVRPPAYLAARQGRIAARDLATLLADGPPNQDQVKRLTRSGMGECQGRRCREQTALLLARGAALPPGRIPLASYRAPVRPLPLALLADDAETSAMRAGWDAWFGIPTQWTPWWDIGTERDGQGRDAGLGDTWHL